LNRSYLRKILDKLKKELDISEGEKLRLELRPMKTKAASISFKRKVIRINKNLIPILDEDCIKYLILHELIHYKLKSTYHNSKFQKQLNKKINDTKIKELERKIITNLLRLSNIF